MTEFNAHGEISKVDDDKRQVFGWASITDMDGEPVIDHQDDWIAADELEKAAYDYVLKSRVGGTMHQRVGKAAPKATSQMIESFVITPEKVEKMGLPAGSLPTGWWMGFKVSDDKTWSDVKKGKLRSFSVHGVGKRQKVSKDDIRKSHEKSLATVWKMAQGDPVTFTKGVAYLADVAYEHGHPDAGFYEQVVKHLIGSHDQDDHDPHKHSRSDHGTVGQGVRGAAGGAIGAGAVGAGLGATGGLQGGAGLRSLARSAAAGARGFGIPGAVGGALLGASIGAREGGLREEERRRKRNQKTRDGAFDRDRLVEEASRIEEEELPPRPPDWEPPERIYGPAGKYPMRKGLTQRQKDIISKYMQE